MKSRFSVITALLAFGFCLSTSYAADPTGVPRLEVGFTYRLINVTYELVQQRQTGVSENDIETAVKMKLLTRGFQTIDKSINGSSLHVRVNLNADAYYISMSLNKHMHFYGIGYPFNVMQHAGGLLGGFAGRNTWVMVGDWYVLGTHGGSERALLHSLEGLLDRFLINYHESNLKYDTTFEDGVLRGVDKVIEHGAYERLGIFMGPGNPWEAWSERRQPLHKVRKDFEEQSNALTEDIKKSLQDLERGVAEERIPVKENPKESKSPKQTATEI